MMCALCGDLVDMAHTVSGREVVGWQKHRTGGGLNAVIARKETGRWACADCMRKLRDGVEIAQQVLPGL